jgi:hypothetical protein
LVDSFPLEGVRHGENLRYLGSLLKRRQYSKFLGSVGVKNSYGDKEEIAVRNLVKGLVSSPPLFSLPRNGFLTDQGVID